MYKIYVYMYPFLHRRQFPPTPVSTPVLPAWQLSNSSPSTATPTKTLVTPGGDREVSEDALLNSNEKDKSEEDQKVNEISSRDIKCEILLLVLYFIV